MTARLAKALGVSKEDIEKCIEETAKSLDIDRAEVLDKIIKEFLAGKKNCITRSKIPPKPHQKRVIEYLKTHRGVIAAHQTGSGKTLMAVIASQCGLDENPKAKILMVTPKSLQENIKKELRAYGGNPNDKRYTFITLGKLRTTIEKDPTFCGENTYLIIDEAHNLRTQLRMIKGKPAALTARAAIQCAKKAWKVLLLTATPLYNKPYDVANLVAMVKGEDPLSKFKFDKLLERPSAFRSYFACIFSFHKVKKEPPDFPTFKEITKEIKMSKKYYEKYRKVEKANYYLFKAIDPWAFLTGVRQATNALSPCQKCSWAIRKIVEWNKEGKKTLVYSSFLTHGVKKLQKMLDRRKIPFVEITGKLSAKLRDEAVKEFNSPQGDNVLFITKAGGEGLDLKGVRNVILLESMWNRPNEEQVIGRAIRYKSHTHLPKNERHVDIYHLVLVKPKRPLRDKNDTTGSADEILRKLTQKKLRVNQEFLKRLEHISIEKLEC